MTYRDVVSPGPRAEQRLREGRKVVAVIGIDKYRAWPRLHNAVRDALGAFDVFQQLGFDKVVDPLLNEAATTDAIRRLVTDDLATLAGDDSLVLFFAGHGHTQERQLQSGPVQTGFLIPVDGDPSRGRTASWLRLDSWLSDVARLPARHILVILDACHSGIVLGSLIKWRDNGAQRSGSLDALRGRQSRRVITSALGDQRAMDSGPIYGHSLFTGCLIEGLTGALAEDGRREVTGSEIGAYVQRRVASYTSSQQTPDFGTLELDDRGELVVPLPIGALPQRRIPVLPTDASPVDRRRRAARDAGSSGPKPRPKKASPRRSKATDGADAAKLMTWPVAAVAPKPPASPPGDRVPAAQPATAARSAPAIEAPRRTPAVPSRRITPRMIPIAPEPEPPGSPDAVQRRRPAALAFLIRVGMVCAKTIAGVLAALLTLMLLAQCITWFAPAGIVVIVASLLIASAIVAGRVVARAPGFLRTFSENLLKRKLWLWLAGLVVFWGVSVGMIDRSRLDACRRELATAAALQSANRDGASSAFLAAASACDALDRDAAEQARRAASEAADSETARKLAAGRAASFASAIAEAKRQPDTVAGAAAAIASYRRALQLGSLDSVLSAQFAIRLYAQGEALLAKGNNDGAIAAFEEAKRRDPDLDVASVLAAAHAAQRKRTISKAPRPPAGAATGAAIPRQQPEPTGGGESELQPVDTVYPDVGPSHGDGSNPAGHAPR